MILENLRKGLRGGDLEGRTAFLSSILLSITIHFSSFDPLYSFSVIFLCSIFSRGRNLNLIIGFFPFIMAIIFSGFFFSLEFSARSALAFAGIISTGAILYSSKISEISSALISLKIPERFVSIVTIAISILPLMVYDMDEISFVVEEKGLKRYFKMLKAFVSTSILRAISLSEALYSKNFNYKAVGCSRKPRIKDIILLKLSFLLFLSTFLPVRSFLQ